MANIELTGLDGYADDKDLIARGGTLKFVPKTGALFFDASKLQHVNHGVFWRPSVDYSHFFWEAWIKPYSNAVGGAGGTTWTGYVVSDNQGGDHNLLFGCAMGADGFFNLTGNIHNGTSLTSFDGTERYPANHWMHVAVGWDGAHIMMWVDGILSHIQTYASGRKQPGGNNFTLHIGGSDHNNFWGYIAQVRAYEGYGRCAQNTDFSPERFFRPVSASSTQLRDWCQFYANYMEPAIVFPDLSAGFEGVRHDGVPVATLSVLGHGEQTPPYNQLEIPRFRGGDIIYGTYVPTAPSTPSGAKVFDSFSRANVTNLNTTLYDPAVGEPTFGSTETGTLGPLAWVSDSAAFPDAQGEILYGAAVMPYNGASMLLQTGLQNADIRVERPAIAKCITSLYFRYKDDNDHYKIWGDDSGIVLRKREAGVTTDVGITSATGWRTLRVVFSGTSLTVYTSATPGADGTSVHTATITNVTGATKHGLFNPQFNIKTMYRADNFLIK